MEVSRLKVNVCMIYEGKDLGVELSVKNKKYVLKPGDRMSWEDRKEFDIVCQSKDVEVDQEELQKIYTTYVKECPQIHLRPYTNPMHMFHHIYCTMHQGIEEILYKADLGYLALYLNKLNDYNLIGTSPSGIFDGLPISLLRTLNTEAGANVLRTTKSRNLVYELYMKKQYLFKRKWSLGQCRYFTEIMCKKGDEEIAHDDMMILYYLSTCRTEKDYEYYVAYLKKCEDLKPIIKLPVCPVEELGEFPYEKAEYLHECLVEHGEEMQDFFEVMYDLYGFELEYEDSQYRMIWPKQLIDLCKEAEAQHSCLWNYLKEASAGESFILFMRKANNPEKSYITVEIVGNTIFQALRKYNKELNEDEMRWLEHYAEIKTLNIDLEVF